MENQKKLCKYCNIERENTDFRESKPGYFSLKCKECTRQAKKEFYQLNKERINKVAGEYNKKYRKANKDMVKAKEKAYREKNKERESERLKKYYRENKETIAKRHQSYSVKRNAKAIKRIKEDILFKTKERIRNLIYGTFRKKNFYKKGRTADILGCSIPEFKAHLESQFENWMNWDNYGAYNPNGDRTWNIDHIIPVASAQTEDDIVRLNHHSNLRPLCSKENRYKSDKLIFE